MLCQFEIFTPDQELAGDPVHVTVVGSKDDAAARELFAAANRFPVSYKRIEWWDRREGRLPNPDVQYPQLARAAAFACADKACSLPVFEPDEIAAAVNRLAGVTD